MSSNERYTVLFSGRTDPEFDPADVRRSLGRLLNADEEGLARLFSGKPVAVKKKTDRRSAEKTVAVLRKIGALTRVTRHAVKRETPPPQSSLADDNPFLETMACPSCGKEQELSGACIHCGIIFAKFRAEAGKKEEYVPSLMNTTQDPDNVMKCPNCASVQAKAPVCAQCGVIIARAVQRRKEKEEAEKKNSRERKAARARKSAKGAVAADGDTAKKNTASGAGYRRSAAPAVPLPGALFTRLFTMGPAEFREVAVWAAIAAGAGAFLGYTGWGLLRLHHDPGVMDAFLNALAFGGWAACFGLSMIAGRNFRLLGAPGEFRVIAFFAGGFWIAAAAMTNRMLDPAVSDPARAAIQHMAAGFAGGSLAAFFVSRRLSRMLPPGVTDAPLPRNFRAREGVGLFYTAGYVLAGCILLLAILGIGRSRGYLDPERSTLPASAARELVWEFRPDAPLLHAVAHPERIMLILASGRIMALDPKTGQTAWDLQVDGTAVHDPGRLADTLFLPLASPGAGSILSLDIRTGHQYHQEDLAAGFHSAALQGGYAWLTGYGAVEKLSLTNWRTESFAASPHGNLPRLPPVVTESLVLIPSSNNGLQVLDRKNGSLSWEAPALSRDAADEPIAGFGMIRGTVCMAAGKRVRGWHPDGKRKWDYQAPATIRQLLARGSRVYIAADTGCAALHPETGKEIWAWRYDPQPFRSLALYRDMLYAASGGTDRKVYRLQAQNGKIRDRYQMDLLPTLHLAPETSGKAQDNGLVLVSGVNPRGRYRVYALPIKTE